MQLDALRRDAARWPSPRLTRRVASTTPTPERTWRRTKKHQQTSTNTYDKTYDKNWQNINKLYHLWQTLTNYESHQRFPLPERAQYSPVFCAVLFHVKTAKNASPDTKRSPRAHKNPLVRIRCLKATSLQCSKCSDMWLFLLVGRCFNTSMQLKCNEQTSLCKVIDCIAFLLHMYLAKCTGRRRSL